MSDTISINGIDYVRADSLPTVTPNGNGDGDGYGYGYGTCSPHRNRQP
jgi:hypothetical protein